jgi:hypothetical protein
LRFYRNTVEISENSENHLKAIVGGRQAAGRDGFSGGAGKVAEKTQGEGKATKKGERGWHSRVGSANYIDLRGIVKRPVFLQACPVPRFVHPGFLWAVAEVVVSFSAS